MSLIFMDGFDASDGALGKWSYWNGGFITLSASTRFNAGLSASMNAATTFSRKDFPAVTKLIAGLAIRQSSLYDSLNVFVLSGDAGATGHVGLRMMANGAITLWRGSTQVATSAAGVVFANTWHYLELSATINSTTGTITARVDGVQVVTFTGNTKAGGTNNSIDRLELSNLNGVGYFDDVYIADDTGAAPWNDFLGDVRVQTIKPSAAGSSTQLAPAGSANNWDNVNELPYSSADYNSSATAGQRDLYAMEDLAALTTTVYGVQVTSTAHKTDSAVRSVKNLVKSGATVTASATKTLAISPTLLSSIYQANPTTSAQWTPAEVNAMETGVEVA